MVSMINSLIIPLEIQFSLNQAFTNHQCVYLDFTSNPFNDIIFTFPAVFPRPLQRWCWALNWKRLISSLLHSSLFVLDILQTDCFSRAYQHFGDKVSVAKFQNKPRLLHRHNYWSKPIIMLLFCHYIVLFGNIWPFHIKLMFTWDNSYIPWKTSLLHYMRPLVSHSNILTFGVM